MRGELAAVTRGLREEERQQLFSNFNEEKLRLNKKMEDLVEENRRLD